MATIIQDGTGSAHRVKVFADKSMLVSAISKPEMVSVSETTGQAYIFANGGIPNITTTDTEHAILHVKNNSVSKDLYIYSARSCSDQVSKWRVYKNIIGGTILSNATAGVSNNLNISSANECDCDVYSGSNGVTYSGGSMFEHWINGAGHSIENFEGAIILGTNDSLTITVELDVAGFVCCRMIGYYKEI